MPSSSLRSGGTKLPPARRINSELCAAVFVQRYIKFLFNPAEVSVPWGSKVKQWIQRQSGSRENVKHQTQQKKRRSFKCLRDKVDFSVRHNRPEARHIYQQRTFVPFTLTKLNNHSSFYICVQVEFYLAAAYLQINPVQLVDLFLNGLTLSLRTVLISPQAEQEPPLWCFNSRPLPVLRTAQSIKTTWNHGV